LGQEALTALLQLAVALELLVLPPGEQEVVLEFFLHLVQLQQGEFGLFPCLLQVGVGRFALLL
jgi:hypothetical protein